MSPAKAHPASKARLVNGPDSVKVNPKRANTRGARRPPVAYWVKGAVEVGSLSKTAAGTA